MIAHHREEIVVLEQRKEIVARQELRMGIAGVQVEHVGVRLEEPWLELHVEVREYTEFHGSSSFSSHTLGSLITTTL